MTGCRIKADDCRIFRFQRCSVFNSRSSGHFKSISGQRVSLGGTFCTVGKCKIAVRTAEDIGRITVVNDQAVSIIELKSSGSADAAVELQLHSAVIGDLAIVEDNSRIEFDAAFEFSIVVDREIGTHAVNAAVSCFQTQIVVSTVVNGDTVLIGHLTISHIKGTCRTFSRIDGRSFSKDDITFSINCMDLLGFTLAIGDRTVSKFDVTGKRDGGKIFRFLCEGHLAAAFDSEIADRKIHLKDQLGVFDQTECGNFAIHLIGKAVNMQGHAAFEQESAVDMILVGIKQSGELLTVSLAAINRDPEILKTGTVINDPAAVLHQIGIDCAVDIAGRNKGQRSAVYGNDTQCDTAAFSQIGPAVDIEVCFTFNTTLTEIDVAAEGHTAGCNAVFSRFTQTMLTCQQLQIQVGTIGNLDGIDPDIAGNCQRLTADNS